MKIAIIGQKGIPAKSGGVERHVEELSTRLVKAGHEVFVYARPNYTNKDLKEYKGVKLISLPSITTKHLDAISHTFRACLDVARRNVDVIHFHSIGPSSLLWLVKILRPHTPVIATFHCQDYKHQKWGVLARLCLRIGEMIACKLADKTITVSRNLRNYAIRKYNSSAIYVPNGVPAQEIKEIEKIKYMGLKKDGYILAVSRLIRHKGLQYLVKAYNQLKTDKKLVIVGDSAYTGDFVKELKALAGDNPNIIFAGNQSGRNLEELFSNAYIFVQPSESEGLSIALLEAMAYAKATLVSDIPENLEVIGPTGFTFRNKNHKDLANRLNTLLRNPEIVEKMGALEKTRVEKEYSWEMIVDKIQKVYNNALLNKISGKRSFKLKMANKFLNMFF
ncbi:glycosyltransferase [Candidatus Falkowbacteria bacterium]|nr:glycosyltransferase [Candidatus Falkowbacteria bacterium]